MTPTTKTQVESNPWTVLASTGLAVSYLSRLENDRITPTVKTLDRIAKAFDVSVTQFFETHPAADAKDRCPVSLSGKCILDQLSAPRGKKANAGNESYSPAQLQVLRLCNFLIHTRDHQMLAVLTTILESLLALRESRAANCRTGDVRGRLGERRNVDA